MATLAEQRRSIRAAQDRMNKGSKVRLIDDVENIYNPFYLRRPSGIMQLDIDTAGGLPANGVSFISGPDNAGKNFLLYNYFTQHQKIYGERASILFAAVESIPDYPFMRKVGCQVAFPDDVIEDMDADRAFRKLPKLTKPERAALKTQIGSFKILRAHTAEELLDKLLIAYESNVFSIIAVDSISVIMASAEASLDTLADNPQQAANASLLTRFAQHLHPLTLNLTDEPNLTTMIFTAQVRSNRHKTEVPSYMGRYMKDWATTGGANASKHAKRIDIQIWSEGKEKDKNDKRVIGKTLKWNIVKGSSGTHDNISGEYAFRYDTPGDHMTSLLSAGIQYGVAIEQEGQITFIHKEFGEPLATEKGTVLQGILGLQGLHELFLKDPDAEFRIKREILAAAGIRECLYRPRAW